MIPILGKRGLLYIGLFGFLILSSSGMIGGLAGLRDTIDLSPDSITGYDGHRAEVEFSRLQNAISLYVAGSESIDLDDVVMRFDILWARANLFMNGKAFEFMRQQAGVGEMGALILETLQAIEDDVMNLERGDLATLEHVQARLEPLEARLTGATTRIADLEVEQRDHVNSSLRRGLGELDGLGVAVGLVVSLVLTLFGVEAIQARRAERKLADYQEHLEDLVAQRTDELEEQTRLLEKALDKERELTTLQRQFVSMVSHEFRTPLAIIDGSTQRLRRRLETMSADKVKNALDQISRSVGRLLHLMESTLSAAQLEAGSIAMSVGACDLQALIGEVCSDQQELAKRHRIVVGLEAMPDIVQADGKLLRQVFSNLLSNAVKYSPEGGEVRVDGWADGDQAVIAVRDHGVGIPEAELPRLFQRFFRASTSTGIPGTGIGLHFVKHLVEIHGGAIDVETRAGEGSTFFVRLPIQGSEAVGDREAA